MIFKCIEPSEGIAEFVKEFWVVEDPLTEIRRQKIIPDGYFELIFHYGQRYRINLHGHWENQENRLFAGQINRFFHLENTGSSGMLGIKLRPVAAFPLFRLHMETFLNRVVPIHKLGQEFDQAATSLSQQEVDMQQRISEAEGWLQSLWPSKLPDNYLKIRDASNEIMAQRGNMDIRELSKSVFLSQRQLQREFKKYLGLTPKRFARIVRLKTIFEIMKTGDKSWIHVAVDSGHFDQSHFIRNFKEFTGEEPSKYGFDEQNMANFFMYE